jgi:predicted nucleic acid-binding protein
MLRLCLDLNVWVAALLADRKNRSNTAAQYLVKVVQCGRSPLDEISLVISLGMLDELRSVITDHLKLSIETANEYVSLVERYASLGAQLTLGGTGIVGLKDIEDAHVLETAIAGRADFLVTSNFKDFIVDRDTKVITPDRYAVHYNPAHAVQIVHPFQIADWFRTGSLPHRPSEYPF